MALATGLLLSAGGSILSGVSQLQQASFQADIAKENARSERQRSKVEASIEARSNRQVAGAARAKIGALGTSLQGSPLEVLGAQAAESSFRREQILFGGRSRSQASNLQSQSIRSQGQAAAFGNFAQAGSTILTGAIQSKQSGQSFSDIFKRR